MLEYLEIIGEFILYALCVFCVLAVALNWLCVFLDSYDDIKHIFKN
jgi:hypothetical protein